MVKLLTFIIYLLCRWKKERGGHNTVSQLFHQQRQSHKACKSCLLADCASDFWIICLPPTASSRIENFVSQLPKTQHSLPFQFAPSVLAARADTNTSSIQSDSRWTMLLEEQKNQDVCWCESADTLQMVTKYVMCNYWWNVNSDIRHEECKLWICQGLNPSKEWCWWQDS